MSFADLKSKRQPKSSKSYVSALSDPPTSVPTQSSPQASTSGSVQHDTALDTGGLYKQLPTFLEIRGSEHSGRGLWAQQSFKAGAVILSVEPHLFVLSNQHLDSHCSSCAKVASTAPLMRCSGCTAVWYCNSSCQKADWNLHKRECNALQKWAKAAPSAALAVPTDAVRCLGRILWQIKSRGLDSDWSKEIQALQSHRVSLQQSASVEAHTHLAHSVVRYLGLAAPSELEEFGVMSVGDLVDLISRFITNTFALTSPSLTPIGVSVSPLVALINHSCLPNAVVVFPRGGKKKAKEPVMNIVALRDIAPEEEVLTAYMDTTLPKSQRQKVLEETYSFTCQCPLCTQDSTIIDPREAVWCPKSCGGTCPLPNEENQLCRCMKCKAVITDPQAVIDAARIGKEALEKATFLQSSDYSKAKQLTTNVIPILLSAGLTPSCHPLLALLKLHQSLLVSSFSDQLSQELLDESIRTAAKHSAGLSAVHDEGHPVRGVALAELGKLLAADEPAPSSPPQTNTFPPSGPVRLKMAYETLLRARKELLVGFARDNDGGEVGREVRDGIVSLEKELGVWMTGVRNALEDMPLPGKASSGR
ncbi:SET domain-containing protein [Gyrodon lividus]|nr:SET domain-containing protein [Gyrodon lividus]